MSNRETGELQRIFYVHETRDKLARDMARGTGEYLTSMAYLHGCPVETHERYAEISQQNFERIFTDFETDTETLLLNLEAQIAKDSLLARECKWIS